MLCGIESPHETLAKIRAPYNAEDKALRKVVDFFSVVILEGISLFVVFVILFGLMW